MVFAVVLGVMVGGAAVLLLQQWARDSMSAPSKALPRNRFPRLAPSTQRVPRLVPPRATAGGSLRIRRAA